MSSFTAPLTVTKHVKIEPSRPVVQIGALHIGKWRPRKNYWTVDKEFSFDRGFLGSGQTVTVPFGAETDFASIPRVFWSILPPDGEYAQAAVLHDWLYRNQHLHKYTRLECDNMFLDAMCVLDVPEWKRNIMYFAVRKFGQDAFDRAGAAVKQS